MSFKLEIIPHLSAHVDEDQLYHTHEVCPVCNHKNLRERIQVIQNNPEVYLMHCNSCQASSVSHMPNRGFLEKYYKKQFTKVYSEYSKKRQITFSNAQRFASHIIRLIEVEWFRKKKNVCIIDFGGGDGSLSQCLAERINVKTNIFVVDMGKEWVKKRGKITIYKKNSIDQINRKVDLVISSASLEHIPYPYHVLMNIFNLLLNDGYFYARTPFIVPFLRVFPAIEFGFPAHLHDFGPDFWSRFGRLIEQDFSYVISKPSIVETDLKNQPLKTIIAMFLKFPANLELFFKPFRVPLWKFVGGWEVLLRKS